MIGILIFQAVLPPESGSGLAGPSPDGIGALALGPTARFAEDGIVFDHPAHWRVFRHEMASSFSSLLAYLATVDVGPPCETHVEGRSTTVTCTKRYHVDPGSIVVTLTADSFPGFNILEDRPRGAFPIAVGGMPAWFEPSDNVPEGGFQTLTWTIGRPGSVDNFYRLTAELRGPGLALLRAQLQGVISSFHFDPPVEPLPQGVTQAPAAAAATLTALRILSKDSRAFACFPAVPGTTREAVIEAWPMGVQLNRFIRVRCATNIEATPLHLWRLRLTISPIGRDGQPTGHHTTTVWLAPDGSPGGMSADSLPDPSEIERVDDGTG